MHDLRVVQQWLGTLEQHLDEPLARSMLTFAFTGEVFERIKDETVAHAARRMILARLPGGDRLAELG